MKMPFNKPWLSGKEMAYMQDAIRRGHISGNGHYTRLCHAMLESRWGFGQCLLTTSCTDALEMCALLLDIREGDEIIMPSYTFVSSALAFVRQGAKIVFADSRPDHPGIDEDQIEGLITGRTKAIVPLHYGGVACDMNRIMAIAARHGLVVIEEAAQAIDSYYHDRPLGTMGHLAVFSFHETKNIQCGEGGLLVINDDRYVDQAAIQWEKGTDRARFYRGEVDKYRWVGLGSSFLPSDLLAAYLYAQLENTDLIQQRRRELWSWYDAHIDRYLPDFGFRKPQIPDYARHNGHLYYLVCDTPADRTRLIHYLKTRSIQAVFHYQGLHNSPFYRQYIEPEQPPNLPHCKRYEDCLIRLPLFHELEIGLWDRLEE
jgi:dTDP-4-amino-4,6-dideoxygalactose transaminase